MLLRPTESDLAEAVARSAAHRLHEFVSDPESEAVRMFSPEARAESPGGDWYGEHVGKWLVTACLHAARTGDDQVRARVAAVVASLVPWQEPDGYLGTYPPASSARFTSAEARSVRTWDLWVHAWTMLGLLQCHRLGIEGALATAERVGRLVLTTFDGRPVTDQGNHDGLSSLVVIEPMSKLSQVTGEPRYAEWAAGQLDLASHLRLAEPGLDPSHMGTGKIYQLLWCWLGMVELHRALGRADLLEAVRGHYEAVRKHHLTPYGGPWGGIATHKECFCPPGYFHPGGLVETCSVTTWLDLSLRLFDLTDDPSYLEEAECAALNGLLGAADANGEDWCYFTFPNGRRNNTYHWACCKSSGAMGLEIVASALGREDQAGWRQLLWTSFDATLGNGTELSGRLGPNEYEFRANRDCTVLVRVPAWAKVEGHPGPWASLTLTAGHTAAIPYIARLDYVPFTSTLEHHGQEIVREEYVAYRRGPFVLASGQARPPLLHLSQMFAGSQLREAGDDAAEVTLPGQRPVLLEPYYRAGGRHDRANRHVWLPVVWQ